MSLHEVNVDMVELARETTRRDMQAFAPGITKVLAPAKVNLQLVVGETRPDGKHSVETVLHTLALHDIVSLWPARKTDGPEASEVLDAYTDECEGAAACGASASTTLCEALTTRVAALSCSYAVEIEPLSIPLQSNLAARAVDALARFVVVSGIEVAENLFPVSIRIEKNIPAQAGLGGGSADAAAALVGAAQVWKLDISVEQLAVVAAQLGADVAFFLRGACGVYSGVGDEYVRSLAPRKDSLVLVKPQAGASTADVYKALDELRAGESSSLSANPIDRCDVPCDTVNTDLDLEAASAASLPLCNNLYPAACKVEPLLQTVGNWLKNQEGVSDVLLCGSGSCFFGVCADFATAMRVAAVAKREGLWARSTMFAACAASRLAQ